MEENGEGQNDNAEGNSGGEAPSWFIDEGLPGTGDRPDWFPSKFKSMKDAMNSLSHLEKKLGTAPVNEYDFGDYSEVFDKDHEAFKELGSFAKDKRMPQEVFSKVLETMDKYGKSFMPDLEAEKAKIGEDADRRIEILGNWAESNLSEDTAKVLKSMVGDFVTADAVKALEEVRGKFMESNPNIPNGSDQGQGETETVEQLQQELSDAGNFKKYQEDSNYRRNWRTRLEKASKNSGYVDKTGY